MRYENIIQHLFVYFSSSIVWTKRRLDAWTVISKLAAKEKKFFVWLICVCVCLLTCSTVCALNIPLLVFLHTSVCRDRRQKWCLKDIELTNFLSNFKRHSVHVWFTICRTEFNQRCNKDWKIVAVALGYYVRISAFFGCSDCTLHNGTSKPTKFLNHPNL